MNDKDQAKDLFLKGLAYLDSQDFEKSELMFIETLKLAPRSVPALNNLAIVQYKQSKIDEAALTAQKVLRIDPKNIDACLMLSTCQKDTERYEEALKTCHTIIAIDPTIAEAHCNLGYALNKIKKYQEAIASFDHALALKPRFADAFLNRGNALNNLNRHGEAIAAYDRALTLEPNLEGAWLGRGNVFTELKHYDEAFAAYDKALALKPDLAEAWCGRGNVFVHLKRYDEAFLAYDKALALKPDLAEAWCGRGNVFSELKQHDEALAAYNKAQTIEPDLADAHFSEASVRLLLGDTELGWKKYESRWDTRESRGFKRNFVQPLWLGDSPILNRTILLHAEQGLGDTLMACRYVPMVAALGAKVVLEVPPPLKCLLQSLEGVSRLIARGEQIPDCDIQCPIMSLPLAFKTRLDAIDLKTALTGLPDPWNTDLSSILNKVPYLKGEPEREVRWRARIGAYGFKVGIAWQGNPNAKIDEGRSIPLEQFVSLSRVPGVRLISLQKKHGLDQLMRLPRDVNIETLGDDFDNGSDAFIDTAAVMSSLDLIITSDTSIAHLAGALARPVWVALKNVPDWRWLLDREDSPWYPTMRLFRQPERDDWISVFSKIELELRSSVRGSQ